MAWSQVYIKTPNAYQSETPSYEDILRLVKFLQNYAETNAILLLGQIPSYIRDNLKLLPSSTTKKAYTLVNNQVLNKIKVAVRSLSRKGRI